MANDDSPPTPCARILAIAERDPRRGLRLARRASVPPADAAAQGWREYTLGRALLYGERFDEAGEHLARALERFGALHMPLAQLHCRNELLLRSQLGGGGAKLHAEWEAVIGAYDAAGLAANALRARLEQIAHLNALGRSPDALGRIAAVAPLVGLHGADADRARLLRLRAVAHTNLGRLHEAQQEIDAAVGAYARLRRPIEVAKCLINRAWLWQRRELFEEALADLERADAVFRRYDLAAHEAFCARDLGLVASRLGLLDRALSATLRARAQLLRLGRVAGAAICDLHLGVIAYYSGLFDLALGAYQRALHGFDALAMQRYQLVCRRNQALALLAQGQAHQALALLDALEPDAQAIGEWMEHAEVVHARGQALGRLGRCDEARGAFERAHGLFRDLGNAGAAAEALADLGWLELEQGRQAEAEALFLGLREALAARPAHLWRVEYGLGRCALSRGHSAAALAAFRRGVEIVTGLRRRLVSEHASSGLYSQARQLHLDAIALAAELPDPRAVMDLAHQQQALAQAYAALRADAALPDELWAAHERQRAALRELIAGRAAPQALNTAVTQYVELLLQIRHAQPTPDMPPASDPLDYDVARARLSAAFPEGWTALTYVMLASDVVALVFDERGLDLMRIPLSAAFEQLLHAACDPGQRFASYFAASEPPDGEPWPALSALGQALLPAAVRERLHPRRRLLIAPGGRLHLVPWPALRVAGAWLCERAVVQLVPDLRSWLRLAASAPAGSAALLVGCEEFQQRAPALPNALATLDLATAHWPGAVERAQGADASRQALLRRSAAGELARYAHIHIASHARVVAANGLLAHLKLADDDLFCDEVARLRLAASLVVLVACDSAWSEVLPGEEVVSLSRAFLTAGARDVVASLWPVYDRAVLGFLKPFYAALAGGADAATAVARAQRALIGRHQRGDEAGSATTSPLVWGGFCVLGAGSSVWPSAGGTTPAGDQAAT